MTPEVVMGLIQRAWILGVKTAMPILLVILVVGLFISVIQAATQIHEITLSFIPKLIAAFFILLFFGPWMLHGLMEYTTGLFKEIPFLIG